MSDRSEPLPATNSSVDIQSMKRRRRVALPKPVELVMASGLSRPLGELILQVTKRSGLWRSEQSDLASELIAHFADGLNRGESEQSLIEDFGDAEQAAKLIRRAKKRNRSWPWKAAQAMLLVVLAMCVWLGILIIRFYVGEPNIAHDYREDMNREASKIKPEDAAWPMYLQALLELKTPFINLGHDPDPLGVRPGEPWWPKCRQFVVDHRDALETARIAAAKPGMGLQLGQTLNAEELRLWPQSTPGSHYDPDRGMYSILLPHVAELRLLAKMLAIDFRRALDEGDETMALHDIEAIIGIARHLRETPVLINHLVSLAITQMALDRVIESLPTPNGKGLDQELDRLAATLETIEDEHFRLQLHGERYWFQDFMQRVYTDDGAGDGRVTPQGLKLLDEMVELTRSVTVGQLPSNNPSWSEVIADFRPAMGLMIAGRGEILAEYDRLMSLTEADAETPLWLRGGSVLNSQLGQWTSSPSDRLRYMPLVLLMPAIGHVPVRGDLVRQNLDAARTAVALARFRRQHGSWPQTLDELVPSFLSEIPKDQFDGLPLKYRIGATSPVLYSVGNDREDGGGVRPTNGNDPSHFFTTESVMSTKRTGGTIQGLADGDWVFYPPVIEPLRTEPPQDNSE